MLPTKTDQYWSVKHQLRSILANAGAHEVIGYSGISRALLQKCDLSETGCYVIKNAVSPALEVMRAQLLPSLLERTYPNLRAGYEEFALFEVGAVHQQELLIDTTLPLEQQRCALSYAHQNDRPESAYYTVRQYLEHLLIIMKVPEWEIQPVAQAEISPQLRELKNLFNPQRCGVVVVAGESLGLIGEYSAHCRNELKLPDVSAGFELDLIGLATHFGQKRVYQKQSRYPRTDQDICLQVHADQNYAVLGKFLQKQLGATDYIWELELLDIYETNNSEKNITHRITLSHLERTLTTEEVNHLLDSIAEQASKELEATRI
jgi:phenylalanyl-tRNA synthetase beta subunit